MDYRLDDNGTESDDAIQAIRNRVKSWQTGGAYGDSFPDVRKVINDVIVLMRELDDSTAELASVTAERDALRKPTPVKYEPVRSDTTDWCALPRTGGRIFGKPYQAMCDSAYGVIYDGMPEYDTPEPPAPAPAPTTPVASDEPRYTITPTNALKPDDCIGKYIGGKYMPMGKVERIQLSSTYATVRLIKHGMTTNVRCSADDVWHVEPSEKPQPPVASTAASAAPAKLTKAQREVLIAYRDCRPASVKRFAEITGRLKEMGMLEPNPDQSGENWRANRITDAGRRALEGRAK